MKKYFLILFSIIIFASCQKERIIFIDKSNNSSILSFKKDEHEKTFLLSFDKSKKIEIITNHISNGAEGLIILESEGWDNQANKFITAAKKIPGYRQIAKVPLCIEYFTPVQSIETPDLFLPFLSKPKINWNFSEISQIYPDIRSAFKINKNEKSVSFFGYRLNNPDYPLKKKTVLSFYESEKKTLHQEQKNILFDIVKSYSKNLHSQEIVWIGANGDMIFQRGIDRLIKTENGEEKLFNDTLKITKKVDFMLGNLEGPVTFNDIKTPKTYNFKFEPQSLTTLKKAGYNYISINNNHSYDYGERGFKDTLFYLEKSQIGTSGAGLTPEQARIPWTTKIKGQELAVLSLGAYPQERNGFNGEKQSSATPQRAGVLWANDFGLLAVKKAFSNKKSINIIMVHGGREWQETPSSRQEKLYKKLITLGADLVLGSHPHVLQGLKKSENGLIAYSMGNFIFPGMQTMKNAEESIILVTGFYQGRLLYIEPIGVKINGTTIDIDYTGKIVKRMGDLTKTLY